MRVCHPGPLAFQRSMTSSGRRMEISLRGLVERGRPPFFTTARDKVSSVSSGSSLYSCGRIECASTLARSDFKVWCETCFLTMVCLSHAENVARSASWRVPDHHQPARKQAVADDAGLAESLRVSSNSVTPRKTIAASSKSKPRSASVFSRLA